MIIQSSQCMLGDLAEGGTASASVSSNLSPRRTCEPRYGLDIPH
jgi:hypothetical protein